MTSSISTPQDPTQLPIVDIVHQAESVEKPAIPYQPMIRRWMLWAQEAGPRMNATHRLILEKITSFANEQGEAIVSQDILTYLCDYSRQKVNGVVQELTRLGFISVRKEPRSDGRYEYNVYRLAAADGTPVKSKGLTSQLLTSAKLVRALSQAVSTLLELVEENGIVVEDANDIAALINFCDTNANESDSSMLPRGNKDTRER